MGSEMCIRDRSNGEKLSTLDDYLVAGKKLTGTQLILEIKPHRTEEAENEAVRIIVDKVKKMRMEKQVEYISFLKEVANMRISEKAKKTVSRKTFMAVVVSMMVCLLFVTPVFAASSFYSKTTTKLNAINGGKSTTSRLVE